MTSSRRLHTAAAKQAIPASADFEVFRNMNLKKKAVSGQYQLYFEQTYAYSYVNSDEKDIYEDCKAITKLKDINLNLKADLMVYLI